MKFPESDLSEISLIAKDACAWLSGKRILLTGGTGFIGKWFLSLFDYLNRNYNAQIHCSVPSRNPVKFWQQNGHLQNSAINVFLGDVRTFNFPEGDFDILIHAATDVGDSGRASDYSTIFDVCLNGTLRVIEFVSKKNVKNVLLLSSGAIYGRQDPEVEFLNENSKSAVDSTADSAAYAEGKRVSEWLLSNASRRLGFNLSIARCFAFIGPGLPLQGPFAAGNFFSDALEGRPINVKGDGTALRTYLYASELIVWLLLLMHKGRSCEAYNVGSDQIVSIAELAKIIANFPVKSIPVNIGKLPQEGKLPERYVPSIQKITNEFGLSISITLQNGLMRHWQWLNGRGQ